MLLYLKDEQIFPVNPPKPKNDFRDGLNFLSPTLFSLANEQGFNKLRCVCVCLRVSEHWCVLTAYVY